MEQQVEKAEKYKVCYACKRILPTTDFFRNKNSSDGLYSYCKECHKKKKKESKEKRRRTIIYESRELEKYTPRQLIEELKRRGYTGQLQFVQKVKL